MPSHPMPSPPAVRVLSPGQLRGLLIVLCAGLALVVAGNSALAIALPDIAADLGADQSELTWIIDAYALTFAALLGIGTLVFGVGFGMGITPGTELIIAGLPAERRSVASAVNDVTREVGGVLGIAVLSSILVSFYRSDIAPALSGLPDQMREVIDSGAGAAIGIANSFGPGGMALADLAREAFSEGLSASLWVGAIVLGVAAVITMVVAPRTPTPVR